MDRNLIIRVIVGKFRREVERQLFSRRHDELDQKLKDRSCLAPTCIGREQSTRYGS